MGFYRKFRCKCGYETPGDMGEVYNIIRSGSFIGNYATLEEMDLYWSQTKRD